MQLSLWIQAIESLYNDYDLWVSNSKPVQIDGQNYFKSEPINIPKAGSLSKILAVISQSFTWWLGQKKFG